MRRIIKTAITLVLTLCVSMISASCSKHAKIPDDYNYGDLSEYIKMPDYKGLEYTRITGEVTDDEVNAYIDSMLSASSETEQITEGTVKGDSVVNIDYVGSVDGVEFEGGTAQGVNLDIANNSYIKGFASGIIGHSVGETFDLNVTFPDNYHNDDLKGKPAVFRTTINYLVKIKKPEFNDEWVSGNTEYKTVEEYREYVRKLLSDEALKSAEATEWNELFMQLASGSEVINYPEKELEKRKELSKSKYVRYADAAGMELNDFISTQMGMTEEQFNSALEEEARAMVSQELILYYIKNAEGLDIKRAGYDEFIAKELQEAGLTEETFKSQNGISIIEYADKYNMFTSYLYEEVMKKIMEYSVAK